MNENPLYYIKNDDYFKDDEVNNRKTILYDYSNRRLTSQ